MKKSMSIFAAALVLALAAMSCQPNEAICDSLSSYVDQTIGSGGHGHVFVGATVPYGMVQLGPTSIPQQWDWCSGYHVSDSTLIGFSHTHLEGTGIGDLFDVTVMPVVGEVTYARGDEKDPTSGMWSYAARSRQKAEPGYYSVPVLRYGVDAELTSTERVGMHRYAFPASEESALVFDLENGGCWDSPTDVGVEKVSDTVIKGWRHSRGWANNQRVFFWAEFSKPMKDLQIVEKYGRAMYARACFDTKKGEKILLKVALSPVSIDGAKANMAAELPGWDFDATAKAARKKWDDALSVIKLNTYDETDKVLLYTALYHTMIHPALFCDADLSYRGADDKVRPSEGFKNYTIFSLWDTYRAAHPLMDIIHPEMVPDMVNTMLAIYDQQGKLPVWHLWGCETNCMVGNPGAIVVGNAVVKGFGGFDKERAYTAMKNSVMLDERGQAIRKQYGFIPSDLYNESIGNDLEYAIADGAVANTAKYLGKEEDAKFFTERSHSYRHYMDPETRLSRGRFKDGRWRTPFNPFMSNHREQDYVEGNAWQYTWLAPQDFDGLVEFYGSKEKLVERLDTLFAQSSHIDGDNASPDISGLIGQYVHGNEPSHHIIYFYTMAGAPGKAAEKIRQVYDEMYFADPNGLAGNEDEGQMSAWYVLSSLGFYQVVPASTQYWFGSPLVVSADVKVRDGVLHIEAQGNAKDHPYIQSIELNGTPYTKPYIEFEDLAKGGTLVYHMGPEPKVWF